MLKVYNLLIPLKGAHDELDGNLGDSLKVLHSQLYKNQRFLIVETTEEYATFLQLKFGRNNIWCR